MPLANVPRGSAPLVALLSDPMGMRVVLTKDGKAWLIKWDYLRRRWVWLLAPHLTQLTAEEAMT